MSEEVQERVEDYLGLERYIEQLRLQRSARLPDNLAPQQTHIYGMAQLFHTATLRVADPHPEFITQLGQRLREQLPAEEQSSEPAATNPTSSPQGKGQFRTIFRQNQISQPAHISSTHPESTNVKKHRRQGARKRVGASPTPTAPFTRRKLATIAAEALVTAGVGAGAGAVIQHSLEEQRPDPNPTIPGDAWHLVTTVEQLGKDPIHFTTATISGYVIRQANPTEPIIAFSAACTHLGCTVQWQKNQHQFECPCHGSIFDAKGNTRSRYRPLPSLETRLDEKGNIYVKVPVPPSQV
jgi:cytochrome b6-f complex iron-sulfur subunit